MWSTLDEEPKMPSFKIEVVLQNGSTHRYETGTISATLFDIERQFAGTISSISIRRFQPDEAGTIREVDFEGNAV